METLLFTFPLFPLTDKSPAIEIPAAMMESGEVFFFFREFPAGNPGNAAQG